MDFLPYRIIPLRRPGLPAGSILILPLKPPFRKQRCSIFTPFYDPRVTVHAYVPSNGICRGFAFKYGKFLLPPRFLTALSVPKVPTCEQYHFFPLTAVSYFHSYRQSSIQTPLRPNISPRKSRCFLPLLLHLLFTLPLREHASAVILTV